MRLIDADALIKRIEDSARHAGFHQEDYCKIKRFVAKTPTIEAEAVRHGKNTSFITTNNMDKYHSRIILDEGEKSHWGRLFYEDDREHGKWMIKPANEEFDKCECSICNCYLLIRWKDKLSYYQYCPNCGVKMDL